MNTSISISFTITNPTGATAHGAVIQTNVLFQSLIVQSTTHPVVGNLISVGEVPPGTTIVSLQLLTPDKPTEINDTISLIYQEMADPVTRQITISIKGM
jgi:hypothetical protein